MRTFDGSGQEIHLASLIGKGAEGSVFAVREGEDLLAKIYHSPTPQRERKISAMVTLTSRQLLSVASWPMQTLHPAPAAPAHGFLMRRAPGDLIHNLYSPKSRLGLFPLVTWAFLLRTAANLARAVATIHQSGHLIGDINHANCFVTKRATVHLIDCDSFQIKNGNEFLLCTVGTDLFTPPELQSSKLGQVLRTQNHDAFGLAILIFHLLFNGRHPFAGRFLGAGDMPIQRAISEYRFAYGRKARERLMEPPPHTLPLEAISSIAADVFDRAFSADSVQSDSRPTAEEWIAILDALSSHLRTCKANLAHLFPDQLSACPWCDIEGGAGVLLFYVSVSSAAAQGRFNLELIWKQIERTPPSAPLGALPNPQAIKPGMSADVRRIRRNWGLGLTVSLSTLAILIVWFPNLWWAWTLIVIVLTFRLYRPKAVKRQDLSRLRGELDAQWLSLQQRHADEARKRDFEWKVAELLRVKIDLCGLADERIRELKTVQQKAWSRQLYWFLNKYHLRGAGINGIGPGKLAVLRSYGIETAADVSHGAVLQVPGFGEILTAKLIGWRRNLEKGFRFDGSRAIDPNDIAEMDRKLELKRRQLEAALTQGPPQLLQIRRQVDARRSSLRASVESTARALAQAECDLLALGYAASHSAARVAPTVARPTWQGAVRTPPRRRRVSHTRRYHRRRP